MYAKELQKYLLLTEIWSIINHSLRLAFLSGAWANAAFLLTSEVTPLAFSHGTSLSRSQLLSSNSDVQLNIFLSGCKRTRWNMVKCCAPLVCPCERSTQNRTGPQFWQPLARYWPIGYPQNCQRCQETFRIQLAQHPIEFDFDILCPTLPATSVS